MISLDSSSEGLPMEKPMDSLKARLDAKLRQWKSDTARQVRQRVAEPIDVADQDALFTFFIARADRGKRTCLIETDGWDDGPDEGCELPLRSIFPLPKRMKLYYWFDFGDDWIFQIGKKGQPKPANPRAKYPRVIAKTGRKPVQYPRYE